MDDLVGRMIEALQLGDVGRRLWEPAMRHLRSALGGAGDEGFLDAAEEVARSAALSRSASVVELLEAVAQGAKGLRTEILAAGAPGAEAACRHLAGLERTTLERVAAGYAAGLEETIDRLHGQAEASSPVDSFTGAMKPDELAEHLSLEVDRCQRMDLSLGLVELAVEDEAVEASRTAAPPDTLHAVCGCLRENLRRYDSIGLTPEGELLLVLPDISRRGLAGAAERLRRELTEGADLEPGRFLFALAHYDYVDVNSGEMMAALEEGMQRARTARKPLAWS
jgi:GGDEF domain-containing protein